jgi:hypothetical protein
MRLEDTLVAAVLAPEGRAQFPLAKAERRARLVLLAALIEASA